MVKSDGCQELRAGELATIVATVHAYSDVDTANFFYATDASNPVWVYIGSKNPTVSEGLDDIEMTYTIPGSGSDIQAVRVQFAYGGPVTIPCHLGSYSERDDVVFKVLPSSSPVTAPPSAAPVTSSPSTAPVTPSPSSSTVTPSPSAAPSMSELPSSCPVTSAVFDSNYGVPLCESASKACDTVSLVVGKGQMSGGIEPNLSNT